MSALSSVNSAIGGARRRRRRRTGSKSTKIRSEMVYMARDDDDAENALVSRWSVRQGGAVAMPRDDWEEVRQKLMEVEVLALQMP